MNFPPVFVQRFDVDVPGGMVFKESSFTEAGRIDCSFLYLLVFNKMFTCLLNFLGHLKIPINFIKDHMHDEGS